MGSDLSPFDERDPCASDGQTPSRRWVLDNPHSHGRAGSAALSELVERGNRRLGLERLRRLKMKKIGTESGAYLEVTFEKFILP